MTDSVFLDTNLWVYYYTKDSVDKSANVSALIKSNRELLILSTQVLGELYHVITRKKLFTKLQAAEILSSLVDTFPIQAIAPESVLKATAISQRYGCTYWDSLIVATALLSNCAILYSEDMQHDQVIENQIRIVNPFA
jgi:predicted nucleic acid-binding protein